MSTAAVPSQHSIPPGDAETAILGLAGRIHAPPATLEVQDARSTLANTITFNENTLHDIASSHTTVIAQQLDRNAKLNKSADEAQRSARVLADDFNVSSLENVQEVESFRETASSLQSSFEARTLANSTVKALHDLKQRYELLAQVEDGVWSGKSADPSTVEALVQLDRPVQEEVAGAAVEIALAAKCAVMRTTVSGQLSTAWTQAVSVTSSKEGLPSVNLERNITLSPPNAPRSTQRARAAAPPSSCDLVNLCNSLDTLNILSGLLQGLHSRIIAVVVEPLLENPTWRPTERSGDSGHRLDTAVVPPQDRLGVISGIKIVLEFLARALPERCGALQAQLRESSFNLVLTRILIPTLPTSLSSLPSWLHLARQAMEWEASLGDGESGVGVLRRFLDSQAGSVWLQKRRVVCLRQGRRVVYEDWSSWESKDTELDGSLGGISPDQTLDEEDDDGWGFNDDTAPLSGKDDGLLPHDSDLDGGSNTGWDFDDDVAPAPPPVTLLPKTKPREAKRLGKKAGPKGGQQDTSPSPPEPVVAPAPNPVVTTARRPQPTEAPMFSSTSKVSLAADVVLNLVNSTLDELSQLLSLRPTERSFDDAPRGISEQLAEAVDLIRASVPIAQARIIQSSPLKLVQLSNDYKYLGSKLCDIQPEVEWMDRAEVARRFATASDISLETFVSRQVSAITNILEGTRGLAETSNTPSYLQVEQVVQQLVSYIKDIAAQLATYVDKDVYHHVLGKLVESTVTAALNSVLALDDITELESQRIGTLLSYIEGLGELFQHDPANISTVAAFVPHWIKFGYLNELLSAKLVEITHLFDNGSLVDFTPVQLGRLVRALFADSPQRATLLDKIEM